MYPASPSEIKVVQATPELVEKTRQDFKDKLQALYDTYPEVFFMAKDWGSINNLFSTGMTDLASALDIKTMKTKYDIAYNGISEIHERVTDENTALLVGFRSILSRLPDDVSLLGKSGEFLAEELVNRYASMTEHQKNLLTGIETNKYTAVQAAYEKGLPELEPYNLKLKMEADSPEAQAALEDMIAYIQEKGSETDTLYKFGVRVRNIEGKTAGRMSVIADIPYTSSAYPDNYVTFIPTIDRFIYNISGNISGDKWIIIDDDESFENILIKGRTVLLNGIPYEIKGIDISGTDTLNYEDYKAGLQIFPDAQNNFIMPYSDVTVTVKWGPVDENANPETDPNLAVAKANALAALKDAFSNYKSNEYTDDGWEQLIAARDAGISEINAAKTLDDISDAKEQAIAAMQVVAKKIISGEILDFGKKLGKVDVYVENTTFSGGAFKGDILSETSFDYADKDTMMTVVLRALQKNGFSWTGQGGEKQKLYITVGDVKNYNEAIDKLTELGAFSSGSAPYKISGSDAIPVVEGESVDVKVETPVGTILLPDKALAEISRQAQGSTVEIVIENIAQEKLTDEQRAATDGSIVYEISIISNGKKISSFGGQKITISLPYTLKAGEKPENVAVWYMNDKGELERISCTYDEKTELASFTTDHLSYYLVGYVNKISFIDVAESDWFYEAVKYAVENGLFAGTSATEFSPNSDMTRAMLVTVLHRMEGEPAVTEANTFTGVEAGQWYTDAVIWANANGIVTGYGEGIFGTSDPVTREQMAAILYRYADQKGYDVTKTTELTTYTDVSSISTWAEPALKWAVSQELITGTSTTTLSPTGTATRAQVAAILQRYIENVK